MLNKYNYIKDQQNQILFNFTLLQKINNFNKLIKIKKKDLFMLKCSLIGVNCFFKKIYKINNKYIFIIYLNLSHFLIYYININLDKIYISKNLKEIYIKNNTKFKLTILQGYFKYYIFTKNKKKGFSFFYKF